MVGEGDGIIELLFFHLNTLYAINMNTKYHCKPKYIYY